MSRLTQFAGGRPPATTSIVTAYSSGGVSTANLNTGARGIEAKSGAGTANTLATILTVSGSGYMPYLVAYSASATPTHTVRVQVIVDGVTAFDATSGTITTTAGTGIPVVDAVPADPTYAGGVAWPIRFNTSLVVKVCSSQSGTDYAAIRYEYTTTAY